MHQELGRPVRLPDVIRYDDNEARRGNPDTDLGVNLSGVFREGELKRKRVGTLIVGRESDQPIVLRDGRAGHMGKGLKVVRRPQRKIRTGHVRLDHASKPYFRE